MTWSDIVKEAIEQAESTALAYSPLPVGRTEIRALATDLGVDRVELLDIDGDALLVDRGSGRFTLFVNQDQPKVRHRFSMAHELGHLLLAPKLGHQSIHRRRFSPGQDPQGKRIEWLCNAMASSILMPRERVASIIKNSGQSAAAVQVMAEKFWVSFEAAARRFVNVNEGPCALLFWKATGGGQLRTVEGFASNRSLGQCMLTLTPRDRAAPISASEALRTDQVVRSKESVTLSHGRHANAQTIRVHDVRVESFGQGRGSYRRIASFIYLPQESGRGFNFATRHK